MVNERDTGYPGKVHLTSNEGWHVPLTDDPEGPAIAIWAVRGSRSASLRLEGVPRSAVVTTLDVSASPITVDLGTVPSEAIGELLEVLGQAYGSR